MSKKFPVYTANEIAQMSVLGKLTQRVCTNLARATEVVNALGTDDVDEVRNMLLGMQSITNSLAEAEREQRQIEDALGTSDLDEMRRMKLLKDAVEKQVADLEALPDESEFWRDCGLTVLRPLLAIAYGEEDISDE